MLYGWFLLLSPFILYFGLKYFNKLLAYIGEKYFSDKQGLYFILLMIFCLLVFICIPRH